MIKLVDDKRITYVKIKQKVTIKYQVPSGEGLTKHRVVAEREPHPDFRAALQALRRDLTRILELPTRYTEPMQMRSVTLRFSDGDFSSVTLSAVRPLERSNTPASYNTPAAAELDDSALERLQVLCTEAARYLDGKAGQTSLFDDDANEHGFEEGATDQKKPDAAPSDQRHAGPRALERHSSTA